MTFIKCRDEVINTSSFEAMWKSRPVIPSNCVISQEMRGFDI